MLRAAFVVHFGAILSPSPHTIQYSGWDNIDLITYPWIRRCVLSVEINLTMVLRAGDLFLLVQTIQVFVQVDLYPIIV